MQHGLTSGYRTVVDRQPWKSTVLRAHDCLRLMVVVSRAVGWGIVFLVLLCGYSLPRTSCAGQVGSSSRTALPARDRSEA
jgi:hypothetical protein